MKKMSLLKTVVVIGLSILLIFNLISVVRADDNTFGWDDPTSNSTGNTSNTSTAGNTSDFGNTSNVGNTSDIGNTSNTSNTSSITTNNSSISTGNATTTLNTSTDVENNEVNSLAYTGIESNSVLVVVILVGAIVAGYSLKKIREYNI